MILPILIFATAGMVFAFLIIRARLAGEAAVPMRHGLERLEPRIAPAALTAKLAGGVLSLSGTPTADDLNLVQTAGTIEVLDGATSLGTFNGVKNITARIQGNVAINANLAGEGIDGSFKASGSGKIQLLFAIGSRIGGNLSFSGEADEQTLALGDNTNVGKNLTFTGGSGKDSVVIGAGTIIGRNATLTAIESTTFAAANLIDINGSLRFNNTPATLNVTIETPGQAGLNIGGQFSYKGGAGDDSISLVAKVNGPVTFTDLQGNNAIGFGQSTIRGSVTMKTGAGNDGFGLQDGSVEGNVSLKLGEGNNSFNYGVAGQVTLGGNLFYSAGGGNDSWRTFGGGLTLAGNVTINLGDGTNELIASALVNGRSVKVTTGSGADVISIDGTATGATVKITAGSGNDSVAGSLLRGPASATYDGGAGTDHFGEKLLTADPLIIIGFEDFT